MQLNVAGIAAGRTIDGTRRGAAALSGILPHVLVVAGALLCTLCAFGNAGLIAEATNSDISLPFAFVWDLLHGGHPWSDFQLPRIPSLVPDIPMAVLIGLVVRSPLWETLVYGATQFIALLYAAGWLVAILSRQSLARSTGVVLALFSVPLLLSWHSYCRFYQVFLPVEHWGPFIASLLVAGLAAQQLQQPRRWRLVAIAWLASLAFLADRLLIVELAVPLGAALAMTWRAGLIPQHRALSILEAAAAGGIAGWLLLQILLVLGLRIAPPPLVALALIGNSIVDMLRALPRMLSADPVYALIASGLPLLALLAFVLLPSLRNAEQPAGIAPAHLLRWFAAVAVAADLVFFACFYVDEGSYRYLVAFRVWPLVYSAVLLLRLPVARRWGHLPAAAVAAGWLFGFGLTDPAQPAILRVRNPLAECLLRWRGPLDLRAGLANYWDARSTTLAMNGRMQIQQIDPEGRAYLWQTNVYWYTHSIADPAEPPAFNFIVTQYLKPGRVRAVYGQPDRVLDCDGAKVWVYRDPARIRQELLAVSPDLQALLRPAGK